MGGRWTLGLGKGREGMRMVDRMRGEEREMIWGVLYAEDRTNHPEGLDLFGQGGARRARRTCR